MSFPIFINPNALKGIHQISREAFANIFSPALIGTWIRFSAGVMGQDQRSL